MMKFITLCSAALAATLSASAFAADKTLADVHAAQGVVCTACHGAKPGSEVTTAKCESCHGNYDKLIPLTDKGAVNPHESHLGEPDCSQCHHIHKKSEAACNQCHDFAIKMRY